MVSIRYVVKRHLSGLRCRCVLVLALAIKGLLVNTRRGLPEVPYETHQRECFERVMGDIDLPPIEPLAL